MLKYIPGPSCTSLSQWVIMLLDNGLLWFPPISPRPPPPTLTCLEKLVECLFLFPNESFHHVCIPHTSPISLTNCITQQYVLLMTQIVNRIHIAAELYEFRTGSNLLKCRHQLRHQCSGAPNGSVPQNICSSGKFLLAGRFGKIICPWKESVVGK